MTELTKFKYIRKSETQLKLTKFKSGSKGRRPGSKVLVQQRQSRINLWLNPLTSTRTYQRSLLLVTDQYHNLYFKYKVNFLKSSDGLITLAKNISTTFLGFYTGNNFKIIPFFKTLLTLGYLFYIKLGSKISKLRDVFLPKVIYAVAYKTLIKVIAYDRWSGFLTMVLPSGCKKLFFYLSRYEINELNLFYYERNKLFKELWQLKWDKAGTGRLLGHKSKVRGVAKNPVDHPHGGRTKSIKLQRTPWGLPTKRK